MTVLHDNVILQEYYHVVNDNDKKRHCHMYPVLPIAKFLEKNLLKYYLYLYFGIQRCMRVHIYSCEA